MYPTSKRTWLPALFLAILLVLLAVLQFRWIGEVSRAERLRLQTRLTEEVQRATREFDSEIADVALAFMPVNAGSLVETIEMWRGENANADLVHTVARIDISSLLRRDRTRQRPRLEIFTEQAGSFEFTEWTPQYRPLLQFLGRDRRGADGLRDGLGDIEPSLPALVLRVGPNRRGAATPARAVLVLVLDREALAVRLREQLFADLALALGADYSFRVLDRDGAEVTQSGELWPAEGSVHGTGVLRLPPPHEMRGAVLRNLRGRYRDAGLPTPPWLAAARIDEPEGPGRAPGRGAWTLEVAHRGAGLEGLVATARLRNLVISASILLLLAASMIYLLRAAARERRLAQQQLDFVAGLTHELHTPLAAIKSAGANLADGVVADPDRVREYGEMLQKEGTRLGDLVGQALHFAGVESSGVQGQWVPIPVGEWLEEAVDRTRLVARENAGEQGPGMESQVEIDLSVPPTPLYILGDREALIRALTNLLNNSVKFGASRIAVETHRNARQLSVLVRDDGPGISPSDRERIFEPYVRGIGVSAAGSGLGLYLARRVAEQHGGSLRLAADDVHDGACFELVLPLANLDAKDHGRKDSEFAQKPTKGPDL